MATIIVTIPNNLLEVFVWFQAQNGLTWADAFLVEKLKELEERKALIERLEFQKAYDALTLAEQADIRARLRLPPAP